MPLETTRIGKWLGYTIPCALVRRGFPGTGSNCQRAAITAVTMAISVWANW